MVSSRSRSRQGRVDRRQVPMLHPGCESRARERELDLGAERGVVPWVKYQHDWTSRQATAHGQLAQMQLIVQHGNKDLWRVKT